MKRGGFTVSFLAPSRPESSRFGRYSFWFPVHSSVKPFKKQFNVSLSLVWREQKVRPGFLSELPFPCWRSLSECPNAVPRKGQKKALACVLLRLPLMLTYTNYTNIINNYSPLLRGLFHSLPEQQLDLINDAAELFWPAEGRGYETCHFLAHAKALWSSSTQRRHNLEPNCKTGCCTVCVTGTLLSRLHSLSARTTWTPRKKPHFLVLSLRFPGKLYIP